MINILAVDDEKHILRLIQNALAREGYHVTAVSDPQELEKLKLTEYQLILLDVMMPGKDGFALCGEIRERVAAHLRRESREKKQAVSVGGVQFLLKAKKVRYKDEELDFTKSEYAICEYLALNHGQVFSKEQIYEHVFGYEKESDNSVITEHIKNIRAKCQKAGLEPIETVWGIGYRWRQG